MRFGTEPGFRQDRATRQLAAARQPFLDFGTDHFWQHTRFRDENKTRVRRFQTQLQQRRIDVGEVECGRIRCCWKFDQHHAVRNERAADRGHLAGARNETSVEALHHIWNGSGVRLEALDIAHQMRRDYKGCARAGLEQPFDGSTVGEIITQLSGKLGEKIELGRIARFETADGVLDSYKHVQNERGVVGVLVELGGAGAGGQELAHDIALHIASAAPAYVSRDDVPADEIERERAVLEAQTREEGKPEQALAKIVEGKLNGYFKNVALLEQGFVKEPKQTVAQRVAEAGADATVRRFVRVKIGEA